MFSTTAGGTPKTVRNVEIDAVHCSSMVHTVLCAGRAPNTRIENIKIGSIHADTCYYGFNCQNNGDDVRIGELRTRNVKRSYFVYGVRAHQVKVYSRENQNSTGDINVSCNGSHTTDLEIYYKCVSPKNARTLININAFGESRCTIHNMRLHLDVESSTQAEVVSFQAYTDPATPPIRENRGPTNNIYDNIAIDGRISAPLARSHIEMRSQPTSKGRMWIDAEISKGKIADSVRAHFHISSVRRK
jgi:hypothetical protein